MVWDVQTKTTRVGKFGCKASSPSLKQQKAAAYASDTGVTNPLFKNGARVPDISSTILDATTFYSATLGVPMARNQADPKVSQGRTLFSALGCHSCHTLTLRTGNGVHTSLSHQTIHPFSDPLLHDMNTELSDNQPYFLASGREWKTPPLWRIGLTETVLKGRTGTYPHDGRARTLEEAILWHAGEASATQARFTQLSAPERDALITFLRSL